MRENSCVNCKHYHYRRRPVGNDGQGRSLYDQEYSCTEPKRTAAANVRMLPIPGSDFVCDDLDKILEGKAFTAYVSKRHDEIKRLTQPPGGWLIFIGGIVIAAFALHALIEATR